MIMIWDLFSSAFRRDLDADKAFPMSPKEQSAAEAPVASPDTDLSAFNQDAIFIARQSIFDATEKVWAYQLLVRPTGILPEAAPATSEQSARLIVDTLNTFGAHTVLGNRLGLISLPGDALLSDIVELLPCSNFILEFPAELLQSPAAEARCAQLLAKGYQLALACTHNDVDSSQIPRTANYVTYDLALQNLTTIASLDRGVKPYNLTRLVRNVNTRADFKACKAIGFDLYQGNFFAKAETVASNRVDPARDRIMEIFNLVMNKADITQIEDAFKHDVALCYSLLCYINSVGIGMQYKVSSIRNAIMLLGYDFLWRWLSLLVYTGIDLSAAQRVLLNTAIIRGRLTELLGQGQLSDKDANALFVVGNFSLLDALLGIPLAQALQRINLPDDVVSAILNQEGKYAPYLALALAFENAQPDQAERLCAQLHIEPGAASRAHLAAIEWAGMVAK